VGVKTLSEQFSRRPEDVSVDLLVEELAAVAPQGPPDIAVAFLPLWGEAGPFEAFASYAGETYRLRQERAEGFAFHRVQKTIRPAPGEVRQATGVFASFPFSDAWLLAMTRDDCLSGRNFTDVIENCLTAFAEVFYPYLVAVTPSAVAVRSFLGWLDDLGGSLRVLRSTMRFSERGFQTTQRSEGIGDTLDRLDEEGGFLHRATYELATAEGSYVATVSRDGLAHFHGGALRLFLRHFGELLDRAMAERFLLKSTGEEVREGYLQALDLVFGRAGLLSGIEATERLVDVIESDPAFVVRVLHGNPYLHLSVMDVRDGSTFSVYSHQETTARIIAGPSASSASLNRMVGRIRREFAELEWEGSIVEV
jgi:hypothetical protein